MYSWGNTYKVGACPIERITGVLHVRVAWQWQVEDTDQTKNSQMTEDSQANYGMSFICTALNFTCSASYWRAPERFGSKLEFLNAYQISCANKTCTTKYYTVVPLRLSFMPVLDLYVILISVWVFFYVILISVWVFCYTTWHVHFLTLDVSEPFFVNMLSIAHPNPHSVMARLSAYLPTDN